MTTEPTNDEALDHYMRRAGYYEQATPRELLAYRRATPAVGLRAAAQEVIDGAFSTYKAKNGRDVSIQADDGEKCLIVHSDLMQALEAALSQPAPALQSAVQMPRAWLDVMGERTRQMAVEGWTPEHDDAHVDGEIAEAAICYILTGIGKDREWACAIWWPEAWSTRWCKTTNARRDLVKAGALILAEIERLDRAALSQNGGAVVEDAPEPIGTCESCGVDIHEGDKCCHTTDGCVLCVEHAPMLSDVLRQMDEVLERGDAEGCYDLTEDELREDRDSIANDIAKNGDRKAVSR